MAELAEPVVSFLMERISNILLEEGKFLLGVKRQADQLQSELKLLQSLLKYFDAKQNEEASAISEWISQSKDLAYEAENSLETFAFKIASRRSRKGIVNVLKRYTCIFNECYMRHNIGLEIQNLNTRVSNLSKRFQEYGVRSTVKEEHLSWRQQQKIRRTYSHNEENDFIGLEDDVKILVQHLVNEDEANPFGVVSICGMGGSGKTTLARKVYKNSIVRSYFDGLAWICISQQWQTKDILQGILVKVDPENREEIYKLTEDELVGKLYKVQKDKRCLIVLDDIWYTSVWESMKDAFPTIEGGKSKILLTTRNKNVAIHIGPNGFHHEPRFLSHDESWRLLQQKALREKCIHGQEELHKLEQLGKDMVKHCGGLPLALVVLGGILATKHQLDDWIHVYQNIKSFLTKGDSTGEREGKIQEILALSYNDLPYHLKPCFLYLGIYPEDSEIETDRLYQLWMAEGMVSKEDRIGAEESMMDVAERYLGELVKRCMIQVRIKEGPALRKFKSCCLHDLMRDLCLAKARDENFLKVIDYHKTDDPNLVDSYSTRKLHRLVIYLNEESFSKYMPPDNEMSRHVRSLTFRKIGDSSIEQWLARTNFNNFRMLRALIIENIARFHPFSFRDDNKPSEFPLGELIHLRYLCIRNSCFIIRSSSIGSLERLETLDLCYFGAIWFSNLFVKMKGLRYLYLPIDPDHANNKGCKLRLPGLINLEILENFSPVYFEVKNLHNLRNLQILSANVYEENDREEIMNCISQLSSLKQATLHFHSTTSLLNPHEGSSSLEKLFGSTVYHLSLNGHLGIIPEHKKHYFPNLIELVLDGSGIERDPMETLEKLPNLQKLWLKSGAFMGKEMTSHSGGFERLRFLSLSGMEELENWTVEKGGLSNLSHLEICDSSKFKMMPDGLRFISKLQQLVISHMPDSFCDRLRVVDGQEGKDLDKVRHIPSIMIRSIINASAD